MIIMKGKPGEHISRAAERAIQVASALEEAVTLAFNDTEVAVHPTHALQVEDSFHEKRGDRTKATS